MKKCYVVTVKRLSYRWSALLSLALVAWLWLAAAHVHADASTSASHPVCELCAGLDRAAAPPPAALPAAHGSKKQTHVSRCGPENAAV